MNRVAIVGYGFMGKTHYGAWKKAPGAKVVAVCDSNLAQLTAKTVGNVKGAADNSKLPKTMKVYDSFDKISLIKVYPEPNTEIKITLGKHRVTVNGDTLRKQPRQKQK